MGAPLKKRKAKKPGQNKIGQPKIEVDLEELEKLGALQCTQEDAAAFFEVSVKTMKRRLTEPKYRDVWERGRGKGRVSLRRMQMVLAETKPVMAIFLGKQILGQRDVVEFAGNPDAPIKVEFTLEEQVRRVSSLVHQEFYKKAANES